SRFIPDSSQSVRSARQKWLAQVFSGSDARLTSSQLRRLWERTLAKLQAERSRDPEGGFGDTTRFARRLLAALEHGLGRVSCGGRGDRRLVVSYESTHSRVMSFSF